jgi:hypothetical protein
MREREWRNKCLQAVVLLAWRHHDIGSGSRNASGAVDVCHVPHRGAAGGIFPSKSFQRPSAELLFAGL